MGVKLVPYGILLAAALVALPGCVRYGLPDPPAGSQFTPLWHRDLSALEHRVAIEKHLGTDGAWTRLAEAWIDLSSCRPVRPRRLPPDLDAGDAPRPSSEWPAELAIFLHATVALEDVRHRMRAATRRVGRRLPPGRVLFERLRSGDFFQRSPSELRGDLIRWPGEREDWADEVPAPTDVGSRCDGLAARVAAERNDGSAAAAGTRSLSLAGWRAELLRAVDFALAQFREIPESRRSDRLELLARRLRRFGAEVSFRFARTYAYRGTPADRRWLETVDALEPDALWRRIRGYVEPVLASDAELSSSTRTHFHLLAALADERDGRYEAAVDHVDVARDVGLSERNEWPVRYLHLRLLVELERWESALELVDELPPRDTRYFMPFAYHAATVVRREGQADRFLGIAKEAFRDRNPQAGPFARALYTDVLRTLVTYNFDTRAIELLEELGPRGRLYGRVREYAKTAIERGRPEQAEAAARWLLDNHEDARFEPRYRGILAMAAFLRDDIESFRSELGAIARRPEALKQAIPPRRRASFFANADSELARILRRILPMMAGWGRTEALRERRKKWLEVVVDEIQEFLRDTESSVARPQLVDLYRLASGLLEDHPRGYAQRVGEDASTPLVLGTVRVDKPDLDEAEPVVWMTFPSPRILTLVPHADAPPGQWRFGWQGDEEEGTDD